MIQAIPDRSGPSRSTGSTLALALAGGGPEGAIYEIGALRALDEAIEGLDLARLPTLRRRLGRGVRRGRAWPTGSRPTSSAGASCSDEPGEHPFRPELFLTPAFGEWVAPGVAVPEARRRGLSPTTSSSPTTRAASSPPSSAGSGGRSPWGSSTTAASAATSRQARSPCEPHRRLPRPRRPPRHRRRRPQLGRGRPLRRPGPRPRPHLPRRPGLDRPPRPLPPGRHRRTGTTWTASSSRPSTPRSRSTRGPTSSCASTPSSRSTRPAPSSEGYMRRGKLIDRGMPGVLAQTFRTLIHSRLTTGMAAYEGRYAGAGRPPLRAAPGRLPDVLHERVLVRRAEDAVVEHAYHATLADLRRAPRRDRAVLSKSRPPPPRRRPRRPRPPALADSVGLDLLEEPMQLSDEDDRGSPVARSLRDALARLDAFVERAV
jgi:NTE family protein